MSISVTIQNDGADETEGAIVMTAPSAHDPMVCRATLRGGDSYDAALADTDRLMVVGVKLNPQAEDDTAPDPDPPAASGQAEDDTHDAPATGE